MASEKDVVLVRIYLALHQEKSIITISQKSIELSGDRLLSRKRRVRKPHYKHLRIGLAGTIQTTINAYRKKYKKESHI